MACGSHSGTGLGVIVACGRTELAVGEWVSEPVRALKMMGRTDLGMELAFSCSSMGELFSCSPHLVMGLWRLEYYC